MDKNKNQMLDLLLSWVALNDEKNVCIRNQEYEKAVRIGVRERQIESELIDIYINLQIYINVNSNPDIDHVIAHCLHMDVKEVKMMRGDGYKGLSLIRQIQIRRLL